MPEVVTTFTVLRDLVRGMSQDQRTMIALACTHENADATRDAPAHYAWNAASVAIAKAGKADEAAKKGGS